MKDRWSNIYLIFGVLKKEIERMGTSKYLKR